METSRKALHFRYSILKWYYSLFIRNEGTGTMFRPLFFHFPKDETIYNLLTQFMLGSEMMVAVPAYEKMEQMGVYFPSGERWYDIFTGKMIIDKEDPSMNITIDSPLNATLPVFIRGGAIIHTQDTTGVNRTDDLSNVFNLVVALTPVSEDSSVAFGQIMGVKNYLDDDSIDLCVGENDCMINIAANAVVDVNGTTILELDFSPKIRSSVLEELYIGNITFYGVRGEICDIGKNYCNWLDYTVECVSEEPTPLAIETRSYSLDKKGCTLKALRSGN